MALMFKKVGDHIVPKTDPSRVKFRTNVSKTILNQLYQLAEEHYTHVNYLLENGLSNLLQSGTITFDKKARPKDRVQFKTSYDRNLLAAVRQFADDHHLNINDVIEYSVQFIDFNNIKEKNYRYRIEK